MSPEVNYPLRAMAIDYKNTSPVTNLRPLLSEQFSIEQGDTLPELDMMIVDALDNVVPLTAVTTITFQSRLAELSNSEPYAVNRAASVESDVKVSKSDGTSVTYDKIVRYEWQSGDNDVPGDYDARLVIVFDDAKQVSVRVSYKVTAF